LVIILAGLDTRYSRTGSHTWTHLIPFMEIRSVQWIYYYYTRRIILYAFVFITMLIVSCVVYYYGTLYKVSEAQKGYLALTGATVLVGEDLVTSQNTTVLIHDGIIVRVGNDKDIDIPSDATILDMNGYTLVPGLLDLHVHLGSPELDVGQKPHLLTMPKLIADWVRFIPGTRRAFLNHGVTTVRSLGDEYEWIMDLRQQLRDGVLEGPRLFAAGPIFTTKGGHPVATFGIDPMSDAVRLPATPDEARDLVNALVNGDSSVDLIKVVQERGNPKRLSLEPIAPDVLGAIVTEAHKHDLPVIAHWGTLEDLKDVLAAGVDGLEHLEARGVLEGWPMETLDLLVESKVPLSPTLMVTNVVVEPDVHKQLRKRVGEFHDAGGRIVLGTDAGMPGVPFGASVHQELELLVESGLMPREALKAATSEAAKELGTGHIGAIEPGRAADLVLVRNNPIQDIQAIRNVVMVFLDGRLVVDRFAD
ncbi:amidohydrolase family protein, partial [Desulfotomaculum sp. 1211_IL3151]|uniref:amidohydrolase family protein n=1 Tax=Desulfotomaculum sp. 1211_IL3151 TaxID=3084055 RepID=UPI002FDAA356